MLGQTRLIFTVLSKFTLLSRKAYFHKPIYQNSPHAWVYILLNCFHKISWRPFLTLLESNAALLTRQKDSRTLERIYRSCLDQTEDFLHISDLYIHLIKCSSVHTPTNNFWKQCIISPKLGNCTDLLKHDYRKNYFNEKHTYMSYNTTKKPLRI